MTAPVWDTGGWDPLPPLTGDVDADVCVVGLGASGLTAALELLDRGRTVVGIDARTVGGGAAGRNGGLLLAGSAHFYHRARDPGLYRLTLDELDRLERDGLMRRTGSLRIAGSDDEVPDCEQHLAALQADGLPAEWYEGPEGVGLLLPSDGVTNPLARCRVLAQRVLEGGARLFERSAAADVRGDLVTTHGGRVRCEGVIVAVDGNLEALLPELGSTVRTARCQMLATAPAPEAQFPRPVYIRWGYDYYQQLSDGRVALGGFRDHFESDEWIDVDDPTDAVQTELERFLRDGLGVRAEVTHRWGGSIAFTPDGLPVLEKVRPGVVAVGAYSGTGNLLGPIFARRAVANL
ncbi:MAG: NAD(P)/FAD-dependent oxidoreductase [Actinomycetota bacterium]